MCQHWGRGRGGERERERERERGGGEREGGGEGRERERERERERGGGDFIIYMSSKPSIHLPESFVADMTFEAGLVVDKFVSFKSLHGVDCLLAHLALLLLLIHPGRPL